jgi:signal transduction histidine kinase
MSEEFLLPVHEAKAELAGDDSTEATAREREIARVEQRARFGELAASLAHEIKNPLAGIQGAVDILLSRRAHDDPERNVLEGVRREVARINNTVQTLLDRARPRVLNVRPWPVNEAVERAVSLARASLPPDRKGQIRLDLVPSSAHITMSIDPVQIEDAVLNLLLNAVDAIDGLGEVTVRVYEIASASGENEAVIEVADTGRGIAPEDLQRIFSPFYTTNPEGTGLGLPAVRGVARAHGGRVEVRSVVNTGSNFKLHLPRKRLPR